MPFREDRIACRAALERALHEYTEYYEKHIAHDCIDFEELLVWKKMAKMVWNAHAAYHIAIELERGMEKDMSRGDHDHVDWTAHDRDHPPPTKRAEVRPAATA